jgi:hypothetical protein
LTRARSSCLAVLAAGALALATASSNRPANADDLQPPSPALGYGHETYWRVDGAPEIDAMGPTVQQTLTRTYVHYSSADGPEVFGFYPGPNYSYFQLEGWTPFYLYTRDTATILPMARYYFPAAALTTSVEEFLRLQYPDGAISATIAPDFKVDKATVVSDEETSLILMALEAYDAAPDPDWLRSNLRGRSVVDRLNAAMSWLLTNRWDPGTGLVKRAHTTDWGDVKWEQSEDHTDMAPGDQWTVSIYDQAIAYAALRGLAHLNAEAGRQADADRWSLAASSLQTATTATLWMDDPDHGYFRIHKHLEPNTVVHDFDEDSVVSIGNAAALYYGLATDQQAPRIAAALERARIAANAPKVGLSLYPPYDDWLPTQPQAQMAPYVYQNGALWDWWAGRQITGEFRYGQRTLATQHLLALAQDWARKPGLVYEWESPWTNRTGKDTGYAGAAAVVGESVVNGLFGLDLEHNELHLTPRLGSRGGYVRVYQAADDLYAAYQYDPSPSSIALSYGTNMPTAPSLHVPLPWPSGVTAWLDGTDQLPVQLASRGEDVLASVVVPSGIHRVEFRQSPAPPDAPTPLPALATPVPPTATVTDTPVPSPTPLPTQPLTATPSPSPYPTATATPMATNTPTATATPTR